MQRSVSMLMIAGAVGLSAIAFAQKGAVTGKSGNVETATPVTSAATVGETTAGYQTEAGAIQERGITTKLPITPQGTAIQPLRPDQAGESQAQADISAQAATRAEMYPGTTLAVDLQSAPQSPAQSIAEAQQHLTEKPEGKPPQKRHP